MKTHKLKSQLPLSPYAPIWDWNIDCLVWNEPEKIDTIRNFLLSKETEILKLEYNSQAGTGLSENDVTTRFGKYNVFDFVNECPEFQDLFDFLQRFWFEKVTVDNTLKVYYWPSDLKILGWFNILRKGQKMDKHYHGTDCGAYLSGNMHFEDYHTNTNYQFLHDTICIENQKGGVTLFPSCLDHWVDEYKEEEPRVSIAFDIYLWDKKIEEIMIDIPWVGFINYNPDTEDWFPAHLVK